MWRSSWYALDSIMISGFFGFSRRSFWINSRSSRLLLRWSTQMSQTQHSFSPCFFFFFFSLFMNGTTIHSVTQVHNSELLPLSIPIWATFQHFRNLLPFHFHYPHPPKSKTTLSFSVHSSTYWAPVLQKKAENTNGILMTVTRVIMSCAVLRALHTLVHYSLFKNMNKVKFFIGTLDVKMKRQT